MVTRKSMEGLLAGVVVLVVGAGVTRGDGGMRGVVADAGVALDRAGAATAAWLDGVFASAREGVERTHGVFVYTPGVGDSWGGNWSGLASVERVDRAVVLVHGLDEPGDVWRDLSPALYAAGHTVIRFDYPNDQSISESGRAMFEAMRAVRSMGVERVYVVGHSMGGLVTREMLTADGLYAGASACAGVPRVEGLVAVGTPFRGSSWARFRAVGEVRDHVVRWVEHSGGDPRALLGFLYDGRGEAGEELMPDSAYLASVSERAVCPEIVVTMVVGRALPVDGDRVLSVLEGTVVGGLIGDTGVEAMVRAADRAACLVGDGVVTEASACGMAGADEVVVRANHRSLLRRTPALDGMGRLVGMPVDEPPAIAEILALVGEAWCGD